MHLRLFGSLAIGLSVTVVACGSSSTTKTTTSSSGSGGDTASSSSGSTSSGSESTSSGSGTGGAVTLGMPLTGTTGQWTWTDFPDAFCANGVATGIGVNLSPTPSSRVLIYMEGGGACWSGITCYTLNTASYVSTGYTESDFMKESTDTTGLAQAGGFFDRTASANPFKDYNYIYVPYCTGDVHFGNNVITYGASGEPASGTHHVGARNVEAYLKRIVPTFPGIDRAYITGSSAGGFGAALNWYQAQRYFGDIRVDLIDDSGTPMPLSIEMDGMGETAIRTSWLPPFPAGCTGCSMAVDSVLGYYGTLYGSSHKATLLSFIQDTVLPGFFEISTAQFETGLQDELTTHFQPIPNFKWFTNSASNHVLWFHPTDVVTNGVTVQQYLTKMVTDDASWASVNP